ncbi:MAG: DUF4399 domain-containing protein [Gemmatimonadaceae bacterium]
MRSIALAGVLVLGAPLTAVVAQGAVAPASAATPATPAPEIYLRARVNGATVGPTFPVVFGLRNYGVAPAGVRMSNTGHFHILIDTEVPAAGVVIPGDSLHRHFGAGQIETMLTLAPGTHTLRLVLGDADHKVIGPALVSAPIRITVRPR